MSFPASALLKRRRLFDVFNSQPARIIEKTKEVHSYEITDQIELFSFSSMVSTKDFPKTCKAVREFTFNSRLTVFVFTEISLSFGFSPSEYVLKGKRPSLASQINERPSCSFCNSWIQIRYLKSSGLSFTHWFATKSTVALRFTFQTLLTMDIQRSLKLPAYSKKP